jgi:hypothetical protein
LNFEVLGIFALGSFDARHEDGDELIAFPDDLGRDSIALIISTAKSINLFSRSCGLFIVHLQLNNHQSSIAIHTKQSKWAKLISNFSRSPN